MKVFALLLSLVGGVAAEAATLQTGSSLTFEAVQNDAPVSGEFTKFDVVPMFADDVTKMQFKTTVDVTSVNATYDDIVTNLKTAEWLDTSAFSKAGYQSKAIKKLSENTYEILGDLSLKGMSQPVSGQFVVVENTADRFVADFEFKLNRLDYKVGWQDVNSVKDEVTIKSKLIFKK